MAEIWLSGPVDGIPALLQPVAHALLQARDDTAAIVGGLTPDELWRRPGGSASIGFHALHLAGATDRLFTYARGEALSDAQRHAAGAEPQTVDLPGEEVVRRVHGAVEQALAQLAATPPETLADPRPVGRARLPSTVLGLLFHAAEHASRHAGQMATLARVIRGTPPGE
jgi:uncharacterized damage-inducible protein DinB